MMSRRKQTKPFKVQDELVEEADRKKRSRRFHTESSSMEVSSSQSDVNSENLSDEEVEDNTMMPDSVARRSKRHVSKCNQCGKVLASALSLARHRLTHSQNKPHQCPKCNAGFKTSSNMHRHLRIHFREETEPEPKHFVVSKTPTVRSPRQNIRTPNKFKEFDVDLVGIRSSAVKRTPEEQTKKKVKTPIVVVKAENMDPVTKEVSKNEDDLCKKRSGSNFTLEETLTTSKTIRRDSKGDDPDLMCHICNKTFISKFGLLTHSISHPDISTRCLLCDQSFITHKGLVMHNIIVHKIMEAKHDVKKNSANVNVVNKGFQDLVLVDFSSTKFPQIAEAVCTRVQHKHPERDSQHIFICKKCNKAFPQLCSLELHVKKIHEVSTEIKPEKDATLDFFSFLNLTAVKDDPTTDPKSVETLVDNPIHLIRNGLDDDLVYASDSVASNNVPDWMNNQPDIDGTGYKSENETASKRPRLMLKIVRKKSLAHPPLLKFKPLITGNQIQAGKYFIDENGLHEKRTDIIATRKLRNFAVKLSDTSPQILKHNKPETASKTNESSTERNVFWCRICNYSSHEKSALVRHLLTHSGIRPYFCKMCNYAFTTKANCERHVRKRHHCQTKDEIESAVRCDMEMLRKAPKDDIYMISGSNSSCPVCGKSFNYNQELKEHLKIHEERQFVCQLCNVRCTTRNNCVRHILYKHPGIPHQEANNIISFVGTQRRGNNLRKIAPKTSATIDISRGSIVPRDPVSSSLCKNKRFSGSSISESQINNTLHSRNFKITSETEINNDSDILDAAGAESTMLAHGYVDVEDDNGGVAAGREKPKCSPKKMIGLLPLMKIKAYNEANTKFYLKMVELYEKVNFFNRALRNDITEGDEPNNELNTENDKAVFECHLCSSVFESKEDLTHHAENCSGEDVAFNNSFLFNNNTEDISFQKDGWNEDRASFQNQTSNSNYVMNEGMDWASGQKNDGDSNPEVNIKSTQMSSVVDTTERKKSQANDHAILSLSNEANSSRKEFTNRFQNLDDWEENVVPYSPSSNKSSDTPPQSDSSFPFISDVSSSMYTFSNKESSYVEDSLLMNLCDDAVGSNYKKMKARKTENSNEIGSIQDGFLSVQGFSSSFPTMVNMDSPTMSRIRSQAPHSNSEREGDNNHEKVLVPSKGRFYTARKCPQCDKSFPWASSLRRHIMTHTGLKLYMCRLCKMRFTTRSNLIRHVYRRHGMAKQHPDFASCLAKLHPSDTLLKEVEANVRRKIDMQRKKGGVLVNENDDEPELGNETDEEDYMVESQNLTKKTGRNDFQSMLEQDPETLLMDLDYSPRDDVTLSSAMENVKNTSNPQIPSDNQAQQDLNANDSEEQEDSLVIVESEENSSTAAVLDEEETSLDGSNLEDDGVPLLNRSYHDRESRSSGKQEQSSPRSLAKKKKPLYKTVLKPKIRNKQSTQFVCGLCKKIFKSVPELREHLDTHDVPHSWHCPICSVPFTNKYNCQRHLTRRHQCTDIEPMYVEDSKHGPRTARGHPRKMPVSPMDGKI